MIGRLRGRVAAARRKRWHQDLLDSLGSAGAGCYFAGPPTKFSGRSKAVLGDNVIIGTNLFARAEGGLTIGDNTHISRNLVLYTVNHDYEGELLPYDSNETKKSVSIGRNVWIGMNVCIAPGATIGDGAIVGMGTVVAGEVPAGAIIGSAPWRVIGHRDADHYAELDAKGRYGGVGGRPLQ